MTDIHNHKFPLGIDYGIESHTGVSVSTDSNGDGSRTVNFDMAFSSTADYVANPTLTGGADGGVSVTNKATGSVDVVVTGSSTTGGSVTVDVLVIGLR